MVKNTALWFLNMYVFKLGFIFLLFYYLQKFTPAAIILISHLLLQMKTTIVHNRDNDVLWYIQKGLFLLRKRCLIKNN